MRRARHLVAGLGAVLMGAACSSGAPQAAVTAGPDIVIGAPLSLSGSLATEGGLAKQGYDLWLDWVNGSGGIQMGSVRHRVQIRYVDDQSKPDLSAAAAEKLLGDGAQFLLGPYGSTTTAAVAPVAERHHVPLVDSNGAAQDIFSKGYRYTFGVLSPADRYLKPVLDMAALLKPKPMTIAMLSADDSFSIEVAAAVIAYAPSKGMQVVANERYPSGSTNLHPVLEKVRASNPDILLNSGHLVEATAINKAARDLRLASKIYAYSVGPSTPEFVQQLGADAEYVLTGTQWTPQARYEVTWRLSVAQFVAAYRQKFNSGLDPDYHVAESTAAALALQKALETARSVDPEAVRSALATLDMNTFFGRIKFDANGANTFKPMVAEQIQQSRHVAVWPPEMASGQPVYPAPSWTDRLGPVVAAAAPVMPATGHPPVGG